MVMKSILQNCLVGLRNYSQLVNLNWKQILSSLEKQSGICKIDTAQQHQRMLRSNFWEICKEVKDTFLNLSQRVNFEEFLGKSCHHEIVAWLHDERDFPGRCTLGFWRSLDPAIRLKYSSVKAARICTSDIVPMTLCMQNDFFFPKTMRCHPQVNPTGANTSHDLHLRQSCFVPSCISPPIDFHCVLFLDGN